MEQSIVPKNMTLQMYLTLLSAEERDLIKHILATLKTGNAGLVKQQQDLVQLLRQRPYPLLQILNLSRENSRYQIGKIIAEALQQFLAEEASECGLNFISFLANFPIDILEAASLRNKLLDYLGTTALSDETYLALLSRKESRLLVDVLAILSKKYWHICSGSGVPSKEYVLYQALSNAKNFVPLLSSALKQSQSIADIAIRNNVLILKVLQEFTEPAKPLTEIANISKWLEAFKLEESPPDLQEVHQFFYADFQRFCVLLDFLRQHEKACKTKTIGVLLQANGVLQLLFECNIDASFEETRRFIESLHKWQRQMPATTSIREMELQTLAYYSTLSTVYDILLTDGSLGLAIEPYYASKLLQLNGIMRQVRNFDVLCSLLEDIFQLVFLRWEQLDKDNTQHGHSHSSCGPQRSKSTRSSSYSDSTDADIGFETPAPKLLTISGRHGFICRGRTLQNLFLFLKNFVTKKMHSEDYKLASECAQLRFQRIVDIIGEALWKYAVLEKIDDSLLRADIQQKFQLEAEELLQLVRTHIYSVEKSSSDDDSRDRLNYTSQTRRKSMKKRRRATFSGGTRPKSGVFERSKGVDNMVSSISVVQGTAATDPVREIKARNMVTRLTDRSIIPQMLGTPENLAIMALALKNFDDVKYIIETFNLKNSDLNRELHFVEQQQQVKQKLSTFYANYKRQDQYDRDLMKPLATVEQIKAVAAKGFEISKFISVIDNFAQTHRLQQTPELKQLLSKHINSNPQYGFLRHFEEHNLNVVIITDLVLNLSLNRDLTSNVLMVIKRQQNFAKCDSNSKVKEAKTTKSQFPLDIGVLPFLENLSECMRLLQDKFTLCELLTNNYYSLKPRQLATELQREASFNAIFQKAHSEIGRCSDLQIHMPYFQNLHGKFNYYTRFSAYVSHLTRLVKLRDQNLELHIGELLKIDPCTAIGELIFECDMTPLEIEANVMALNLNLVHVIALNICPEIGGRWGKSASATTPVRQKTILNYISQQSRLLACLLENIIDGHTFDIAEEKLSSVFMKRYLELPEIEELAALYDGNHVITVLRSDNLNMERLHLLPKLQQIDILRLQIGNRAFATKHKRKIDKIVIELIKEDARNIHLAAYISDLALKAKMIQENFTRMATTRLAKQLIESTLRHKDATVLIPPDLRQQLEHTLLDITIYAKVSEVLQFETWPQAYDFGLKTPNVIFRKLLQQHLYKLCYEWCIVVKLADRFVQFKRIILSTLLEALLELHVEDEMNTYLLRILETFPREDCISFLDENKDKFRSLLLLQYAIDFLTKYAKSTTEGSDSEPKNYCNYQISLGIFQQLTLIERDEFWHLFKSPLLIIEQLIMNAKFETLAKVLTAARKSLNEITKGAVCGYCFDKRGHIYDIHTKHTSSSNSPAHKIHFQIGAESTIVGSSAHSAFMLLNFNLYQQDHYITHECIDLLLRIYATKALDYHVSENYSSSSERASQFTDMQQSVDSLYGAFEMPKTAPMRADWIKDEDATHCMCCRRVAFTMLMRRHHCRRCGRVVCFACSPHRMLIPEIYANVEVRVCNDCQRILEETQRKAARDSSTNREGATTRTSTRSKRGLDMFKWHISGNITHDKLLREEFCYEHAPSVALCLSILGYHVGQKKCVELLLYHCRKLEKLFVPNPEVDYELVAKMMNCLALAAKVRGGPAEIESIREHSEIIMSVVQNGCESLIPPGPLNNHSLRKLADALVQAENWSLALEVHLKCGFSTAGVMAAHGLACLRSGCFDTAREKLSHCMPKLTNENVNTMLRKFMLHPNEEHSDHHAVEWLKSHDIPKIRRPQRGPPLLQEILKIIESTAIVKPQPETLQRASVIRNSNTSLASMLPRRKEAYSIPMHEPALNILTTLANLKRISKGDYGLLEGNELNLKRHTSNNTRNCSFEESLHYVLTYGSHADVMQFLMHHQRLNAALRYFLVQQLDAELFIQLIYLVCLRCGEVPTLIETVFQFDARLSIWQQALTQTCRYLESQNLLNSLYQLQMLLKDPVRASMTCVKFYTMDCENFQQLHANAEHLNNAHKHLQTELELTQWENMSSEQSKSATSFLANAFRSRKNSTSSRRLSNASLGNSFFMQMEARSLNTHINTILVQLEVAKFLAKCERDYNKRSDELTTLKILKQIRLDSARSTLPTLFDGSTEKVQICILILYCGKNIEEGFGLAYRIIQGYKLPPMKIFAATAKYLARNQRLSEVEHLLNCITSNNGTNNRELDELLSIAINSAVNSHEAEVKTILDNLIKKIHSVELRISSHIFIGQLKSAYLLANKHERLNDIRKILRQAELTKQIHIKRLCERKLNMTSSTNSGNSQASE